MFVLLAHLYDGGTLKVDHLKDVNVLLSKNK